MSTTIWKVANSGFRWKDEVQNQGVYNLHFAQVERQSPKPRGLQFALCTGWKTKSKIKGFTICTLHRLKDEVQNQGVYNLHFALDVDNGLPKLD